MAPPPKRRGGGRVTPKGGPAAARPAASTPAGRAPVPSGRYTPPIPKSAKVSPPWVPVLMFTLLGLGGIVILLNYLGVLPGATDNWYLVVGLVLILAGIVTATQYH